MTGYLRLLRDNPQFARLWAAQVVSLLGDWFNTIVLFALVSRFSGGSGLAISVLLLARFLPPLLVSPLAGVLLDRFNRKHLLILSDVTRAAVVLLMLLVDTPDELWLLYVLTVLQFAISALFEPGRSALTPSVVARADLVKANVLGSLTWSVVLAVGGALGGLVTGLFGREFALVFDAATFLVSALLIAQIQSTPSAEEARQPEGKVSARDFLDGVRYAAARPSVAVVLLVKLGGSVGSLDTLLVIYGTLLFALGQDGALSIGILWAAFGVGAVLGPIALNRFNDGSIARMRRLIIVAYAVIAAGWFGFAVAPTLALAALALLVKAMGSNIYWTFSSVILQKSVEDRYLGRLFSLDMAGFQLATALSAVITGLVLTTPSEALARTVVIVTGLASLVPLVAWALAVRWLERHEAAQVPAQRLNAPGAALRADASE